jgi:hypothetical protein
MRRIWSVVLALVLGLMCAAPVAGDTTRHAYACSGTLTNLVAPGTFWVEDGALHMRGFLAVYELTGDELCAGTLTGGANFNLDLATWSGVVWGTSTIELDAYDGGFRASLVAHFTADDPLRPDATDIWAGKTVRHGYGELAGWQARGTLIETTHASLLDAGEAFGPGE